MYRYLPLTAVLLAFWLGRGTAAKGIERLHLFKSDLILRRFQPVIGNGCGGTAAELSSYKVDVVRIAGKHWIESLW